MQHFIQLRDTHHGVGRVRPQVQQRLKQGAARGLAPITCRQPVSCTSAYPTAIYSGTCQAVHLLSSPLHTR